MLGTYIVAAPAARVRVARRACRVFAQARFGVLDDILVVPIATDHDHIVLRGEERANLLTLVVEAFEVRMVVDLARIVGPQHRRRANQDLEGRIRCGHRLEKPCLLFSAPDRFLGAVRVGVGAAKVAIFHHPDLQVLAPAIGSISRVAHRYLFEKHPLTHLECEVPHDLALHRRPAVIRQRVVIVLHEVGRHDTMEVEVRRQAEHARPAPTREL